MTYIQIKNMNKYFGKNHVLKNINLDIEDGEFMTFLGPSGCGKTTTLRTIAGLENPDSGTISINGTVVADGDASYFSDPSKRGLNLVFQNYALWPHMTVYENVSFGLEIKKMSKADVREKVQAALDKMKIGQLSERYPSELSGGQQQRVAIARAIVTEPRILLLDEPLSNLDAKLRIEMRSELKRLHRELKTTIIYVTHDQIEALTLSTKIAVFFDGKLLQLDSPMNLYTYPNHLKVADFIGNPQVNFVEAKYNGGKVNQLIAEIGTWQIELKEKPITEDIILAIKPEDILLFKEFNQGRIPFEIYSILPAGAETLFQLKKGDTILLAKVSGEVDFQIEEEVWVEIPEHRINVYDKETSLLISKTQREKFTMNQLNADTSSLAY